MHCLDFNGLCVDIGGLCSLSELLMSVVHMSFIVSGHGKFRSGINWFGDITEVLISSSSYSISYTEILDLLWENLESQQKLVFWHWD